MMIRKKIMRILHPRIDIRNFKAFLYLGLFILSLALPISVHAAPVLTVEPVTWNIIGLDSNDVTSGPNQFPVGARVCNTGDETADNVEATFVWDSANSYIDLRPGTASTLPPAGSDPINLAAGDCIDAYFEAEVTRDAAAFDTSRRYHIEITADNAPPVSTPTPRELYVKKLVSQARNSTIDMQLSTDGSTFTSIAPGGTMSLIVGNTYWIKLVASTATNGYEQIESFINFPNIIFQLLSVTATYGAETSSNMSPPYDTLYGDACTWENDPNSPNYQSCLSTGKAGGDITVTFEVKILSVPIAPLINPEPLSMMIFDFSGASVHYNSDFSVSARYGEIVDPDPTNLTISKNFSPDPIGLDGTSALTFTITNPYSVSISNANFIDTFPTDPGAMTLANTTTINTCGGYLYDSSGESLNAGDVGIQLTYGVIPANGSCSITVNVTAPALGTYSNTSQNLFIGTDDTGNYASDTLVVTDAPPPPPAPTTCADPVTLVTWTMPTSGQGSGGPPPPYTTKDDDVATAIATANVTGAGSQSISTEGVTTNAWQITDAWPDTPGAPGVGSSVPYFQFSLDTSKYGLVTLGMQYDLEAPGDWASNANNHIYIYSSTDNSTYSLAASIDTVKGSWQSNVFGTAGTTGDQTTYFRVTVDTRGNKDTSTVLLDNISISGCRRPDPPTITKSFSPGTVAVGDTSTLTFTITNPNTDATTILSGISFSDFLPIQNLAGSVTTNGTTAVVGSGTAFTTQLASDSIVYIPSTPTTLTGTLSVTQGSQSVTGSDTSFTTQLAVGSLITIASVDYTVASLTDNSSLTLARPYRGATASSLSATSLYPNTYTVSSITDDTHLTLTTSAPAGSSQTMSAGLTLTGAPTTTCNVSGSTVTGVSGQTAISLSGNSLTGTVSVTNNSATVTGTGTSFTTQLAVGSNVYINSVLYKVETIPSTTSLTLSKSYTGATASGLTMTTDSTNLTGTVAVTNGSTTVNGTGTTFTTQLAVGNVVTISGERYSVSAIGSNTSLTLNRSYTGTTASGLTMTEVVGLSGGGTCTVTATVKDSVVGVSTNISGIISSTEGGQNTTSSGYATASLTALKPVPPFISKKFSPNPMLAGGTSTLTFTITNPNPGYALTGVSFSDTFPTSPAAMTVASPLTTTNTCGGSLLDNGGGELAAGDAGIQLTGGSVSGGSTCSVSVNVTASTLTTILSGTISLTNSSATVTGLSTSFSTELGVGYTIYILGTPYVVASIASDLSLTLTQTYAGPTASGLTVPSGYFNMSGNVSSTNGGTGNIASDTLMVRDAIPGISLLKQVGSSLTGPWFDTLAINTTATPDVYYQFTVENTGDVALDPVSVTDPTVSTASCSWPAPLPVAVAANDNHLATCVVGPVAAVSGSHTNTAYSTGTCGVIGCPATSPDDTATYKTVGLTIDKSVLEDSFVEAGDELNYSFLVTNSGFASLFGPVTVDDDKVTVTCPAVSTVGDNDNYFDPGESMICGTHLTGTVAVTNSSPNVTGSGTSFSTQLIVGDIVYINSVGYTVLSITDNTNLTLFTNYTGTDATGLAIFTTAPYTVTGPDNVAEFVTNIADASTTPTPNADIPGVTSAIDSVTVLKKPTLVTLSSFRAYEENGGVVVRWETSSEHNTMGFVLLRLDESAGDYTRVHTGRLPGVMRPPQGGIYSLIDRGASPGGTYTYKLVEIERTGKQLTYGPFTVVAGADDPSANVLEEAATDPVTSAALRLTEKAQKRSSVIRTDSDKGSTVVMSSIAGNSALSNPSDYSIQMREPSERDQVRVKARQIKSKARIAGKPKPQPGSGSRMKLSLIEDGMYYVAAADIANAIGVTMDKIPSLIIRGRLSLSTQGQQVAYLPAANNAGIYFYATAIDSIYTKENIYWIEQGKGTLMDSEKGKKGRAPSSAGSGTFTESLHFEKDTFMDTYAVPDPDADYWFWADLYSPPFLPDYPDVREITVHLDGVADTGTASINANLYGAFPVEFTPHNHARIFINDCPAGEGTWSGMQPYAITAEFSQSCLVEGDNVITVQNVLDSGVYESYIYVDSFDLTYMRNYEAANNRLLFRGDGNSPVTVSGFTSPDIMVFDITNTLLPIRQKHVALNAASGTVRLVPETAATPYYAVSGGGIKTAESESVPAASLALSNNSADYVIIAPEEFVSTAQGLADYRKTQGLQAKVVRLEDVINEFSYGISSPEAIRNFITHALSNWTRAPRFVVLAGDASIDYKNNMGFGTNMIPTKIVSTPYGPYASDTYLADVNGDHVPEVAIGRLPALTTAELQTLIDKIKTYESNTASNLVVLLADNPDDGGNFDTDSTLIGSLIGSKYVLPQPPLYLGPLSRSTVRTKLFASINSIAGVPYVNYIGHGGLINFASENLLTLGDLSLFTNSLKLPVLTAMTCLSGNFEGAGYTTLSEGLVLKPNGGMAAVWSPTGFSDNSLAAVLDRAFYQTIVAGTKQTLGEAVNEALRAYEITGEPPFMMDIYNILGDPALRLKLR